MKSNHVKLKLAFEGRIHNRIFFLLVREWLNIRETSEKYNLRHGKRIEDPVKRLELKKKRKRMNPRVYSIFKEFEEFGWLKKKRVAKEIPKKSKKGKHFKQKSIVYRYRIDLSKVIIDYMKLLEIKATKWQKRYIKMASSIDNINDFIIDDWSMRRNWRRFEDFPSMTITEFIQRFVFELLFSHYLHKDPGWPSDERKLVSIIHIAHNRLSRKLGIEEATNQIINQVDFIFKNSDLMPIDKLWIINHAFLQEHTGTRDQLKEILEPHLQKTISFMRYIKDN